jgi:hypothetical protein
MNCPLKRRAIVLRVVDAKASGMEQIAAAHLVQYPQRSRRIHERIGRDHCEPESHDRGCGNSTSFSRFDVVPALERATGVGALQLSARRPSRTNARLNPPTVTRMAGAAIRSLDDHVCRRIGALTPMGEYQRE